MHRRPLLELLSRYADARPDEKPRIDRIRQLVSNHENCFERTCLPGHITASAWILSADHCSFLLTHHRKLERWLQLGGHADGETDVVDVVLREAREESGMGDFELLSLDAEGRPIPIDIDVHTIPARPGEPEHEHHDVRFLLAAAPGQTLQISDESLDLRWFATADLARVVAEPSMLRMAAKVASFLDPPLG